MSIRLLNITGRVNQEPGDETDASGNYQRLDNGNEEMANESNDVVIPNARHASSSSLNDLDSDTKSSSSDLDFSLHQAASEGSIDHVKRIFAELEAAGDNTKYKEIRDKFDTQGATALHLAARHNRKNVVAYLLDIGANKDEADQADENTPVLLATKYNMKLTAKLLIERGASASARNKYGTTALHFCARRGNAELCNILFNHGTDVDVNATDNGFATPLHMAMLGQSEEVTKLLIEKGAEINAKDIEGEAPIHFAAAEDAGDLINILAKGALIGVAPEDREKVQREFVNLKSDEKDTALHLAAQSGYEETVKTLISIGADVRIRTDTGQTALHLAAISGQIAVVRFLVMSHARVNAVDGEQMTPLHRACQFGRLETAKFLLGCGASLNARDKDGFTPLMCATWKGHDKVTEYLLEQGAKISMIDSNNKCVLHLATEEMHYETLDLLLKKGGLDLINTGDKDYRTPLHHAAIIGDEKITALLVNNKAKVDLGDHEEKTPLHLAAQNGKLDVVNFLGKHAPGTINFTDDRGRSPIHLAAMNGFIYVTESLIRMGAETSCRDDVNWTPLDYAAQKDFPKTMKVLLDNGAVVDAFDINETSPLHHASANGNVHCINMLLDRGASIALRNVDSKNCVDLALENFQRDACKAIIKHKRWEEAVRHPNNEGVHALEKIIEVAPEVAQIVLDKCFKYPKNIPKDSEEYYEEYNFELLDPHPDKQVGATYFAPSTMVRFQKDELLAHPLTVMLINDKWSRLGRWIYVASLCFYLLFVSLLTALVVLEKDQQRKEIKNSKGCYDTTKFGSVVPWMTFGVACFQIVKELIQAMYLGRRYLRDPVNWFEFCLYSSTFLFMLPFILCKVDYTITQELDDMKWQAGALSILFAWFNLMLYLKRFPIFGLYVVMFTEILTTLLNVLLVFSIMIVGFSLSFFCLLDVQSNFKMPGRSIVRTSVMMIGELDYRKIFTENFAHVNGTSIVCNSDIPNKNCLPHKGMTMLIFILFMVFMSIIVMNLLVGLAVGDIESVRKNAYLRILKSQVHILEILDRTYPKFLLRKVYQSSIMIRPKQRSYYQRFTDWVQKLDSEALKDEQGEMAGTEEKMAREVTAQRLELEKQKEKMKTLISMLEEHAERTRKIAKRLNVVDPDHDHS